MKVAVLVLAALPFADTSKLGARFWISYSWGADGDIREARGVRHEKGVIMVVWVHRFERDADGGLQELDCIGETRRLPPGWKLDVHRGSALPEHRHIGQPSSGGRAP